MTVLAPQPGSRCPVCMKAFRPEDPVERVACLRPACVLARTAYIRASLIAVYGERHLEAQAAFREAARAVAIARGETAPQTATEPEEVTA